MPINELRAIDTFAKAVALGSIRRAAIAQGVTPQAASQTLAQLEKHLGVRLLHRTTRSVRESKDEIAAPLQRVPAPGHRSGSALVPQRRWRSRAPARHANPLQQRLRTGNAGGAGRTG